MTQAGINPHPLQAAQDPIKLVELPACGRFIFLQGAREVRVDAGEAQAWRVGDLLCQRQRLERQRAEPSHARIHLQMHRRDLARCPRRVRDGVQASGITNRQVGLSGQQRLDLLRQRRQEDEDTACDARRAQVPAPLPAS